MLAERGRQLSQRLQGVSHLTREAIGSQWSHVEAALQAHTLAWLLQVDTQRLAQPMLGVGVVFVHGMLVCNQHMGGFQIECVLVVVLR